MRELIYSVILMAMIILVVEGVRDKGDPKK